MPDFIQVVKRSKDNGKNIADIYHKEYIIITAILC